MLSDFFLFKRLSQFFFTEKAMVLGKFLFLLTVFFFEIFNCSEKLCLKSEILGSIKIPGYVNV